MKRETYSEEYRTVRISYPSEWNFACPSCGEKVRFRYPDDGKLVHTLKGPMYQIVNLYSCTNGECEFSKVVFNPCPRYDYSQRSDYKISDNVMDYGIIYSMKFNSSVKRFGFHKKNLK